MRQKKNEKNTNHNQDFFSIIRMHENKFDLNQSFSMEMLSYECEPSFNSLLQSYLRPNTLSTTKDCTKDMD